MKLLKPLLIALLLLSPAYAAPRKPLVNVNGVTKPIAATDTLQLPAPTTGNASIILPHGAAPTGGALIDGGCWTTTAGLFCRINGGTVGPYVSAAGAGSVSSVDVSGGTTGLSTSGGPITSSGTVTLAGTVDVDNGGTGQTSYTDGQLLIGNTTGNTLTKSTLTAGTGITVTNGGGSITVGTSGAVTANGYTMSTSRLLGRTTASTGAIEEISVGSNLSLSGGSLSVTGGTGGVPTLLETQSPSGASQVDFEAFSGGGYSLVWIICDLNVSTDGAAMQARLKFNGTYQTAGNYHRVSAARNTSGTTDAMDTTTGTVILLSSATGGFTVGNDTTENFTADIRTYYPDNATKNKRVKNEALYSNASGALIKADGSGMWTGTDSTLALQGIRIFPSAGTITGTCKEFGLK